MDMIDLTTVDGQRVTIAAAHVVAIIEATDADRAGLREGAAFGARVLVSCGVLYSVREDYWHVCAQAKGPF